MPKDFYLKDHRLADVIALVQVLALDEHAHRSVDGLKKELQGDPKSGGKWSDVAKEHPELFRYNEEKHKLKKDSHPISLIARHVWVKDSDGKREIPFDLTKKLIETAIQLHDKEKERRDWWKSLLPLLVAIITVLSSAVLQLATITNQNNWKQYEEEVKPRREAFKAFMGSVSISYSAALRRDSSLMTEALDQCEENLYSIELFLEKKEAAAVLIQFQSFRDFCFKIATSDTFRNAQMKSPRLYSQHKEIFRNQLEKYLSKRI